ncbi:hypothetical protein CSKR_104663 [Clonorchis sinensis]|uniref:Uncharacterized protein n=1 Tax=Clonorchis sinensis TaxID=79923 RepID=A0A3R7JL61_CLOSI|nr:hypothetical protein CSKR_104663 [Clonorchis sinensis]
MKMIVQVRFRAIWVQLENEVKGTCGPRLPDEPQEGRNRSWAVTIFNNLMSRHSPPVSVNLMLSLNPNWTDFDKCNQLQINLGFMRDPAELLVCDILQLKVLHRGRFMFQASKIHSFANEFGFARESPGTQLNLPFAMFSGN